MIETLRVTDVIIGWRWGALCTGEHQQEQYHEVCKWEIGDCVSNHCGIKLLHHIPKECKRSIVQVISPIKPLNIIIRV